MEKFLKRRKRPRSAPSINQDSDLEEPTRKLIALPDSSVLPKSNIESSIIKSYKDKLSYDPKWKKQYPWVEYNSLFKGMVCSVCTTHGKMPVQT